jgi:hypothetical protein
MGTRLRSTYLRAICATAVVAGLQSAVVNAETAGASAPTTGASQVATVPSANASHPDLASAPTTSAVTSSDVSPPISAEERIARYTWWLTLFTAVLAVSTIGLWWMARGQSKDMKKSIEAANDSVAVARESVQISKHAVAAAKISADAAQKTVGLAFLSQRAYLFAESMTQNANEWYRGIDDHFVWSFRFTNHGRTSFM